MTVKWNKHPEYDADIAAGFLEGMTARDIAAGLATKYGLIVSGDQVSGRISRIGARPLADLSIPKGPSLDQVVKNHVKILRSAIRLRHSIEADNELENAIPALRARLALQLQEGRVEGVSVADMLAIIGS